MGILNMMEKVRVIPVAVVESPAEACVLADAMQDAGILILEITFRTPGAVEAIRHLRETRPEMMVGAGTILTLVQAEQALHAGACFMVSPGLDEEMVAWCRSAGIPLIPGVATPSEVMAALRHGLHVLKFFPAEAIGGVNTLKALAPVFPHVRFIPTGGIHAGNLVDYLRLPNVIACGGTWLADRRLIREGRREDLARLAREARALAEQAKGSAASSE